MKRIPILTLSVVAFSGLMMAQDPPSGWRRMGDPAPASAPTPAASQQDGSQAGPQYQQPQYQAQDPAQPADRPTSDAYGQPATTQPQTTAPAQQRPNYGPPPQLTIKPGTFVTVRINQPLSTDHNHVGDTFSVALMSPIIVDGVIVANRGQLGYGRVAELEKQHSDRPSRLGLELTGVTLADGTQAPLTSQLVAQQGGHTPGAVQGGTIVGTTAVGAAVGGVAAGGAGAAAGAGIGAAAGIVGVLLTRNHATMLYPETALTFQITSPVTVVTSNSPQAYRFVGAVNDRPTYSYSERPGPQPQMGPAPVQAPPPAYYYGAYGYPYGAYGYGYPYYPYYYGPSLYIGGGWGWGGGWGRGFGGGFGGFRGGRR